MTNFKRTRAEEKAISARVNAVYKAYKVSGKSQESIAHGAGITLGTLTTIFKGRRIPNEDTLLKIEAYMRGQGWLS